MEKPIFWKRFRRKVIFPVVDQITCKNRVAYRALSETLHYESILVLAHWASSSKFIGFWRNFSSIQIFDKTYAFFHKKKMEKPIFWKRFRRKVIFPVVAQITCKNRVAYRALSETLHYESMMDSLRVEEEEACTECELGQDVGGAGEPRESPAPCQGAWNKRNETVNKIGLIVTMECKNLPVYTPSGILSLRIELSLRMVRGQYAKRFIWQQPWNEESSLTN